MVRSTMASGREDHRKDGRARDVGLRAAPPSGKPEGSGGLVVRILKVVAGVLVVLVIASGVWWQWFRMTPEQEAEAIAADAILTADGADDGSLGDLGEDMEGLGMNSGDEAEADQILDDLLAE
jgi:hypothetical protein